jgi:hypothetical protein
MHRYLCTRIGLLALVGILAACGTTAASPDHFVIKAQPHGKISLGITFEFSGIAARQPRTSPIDLRIRLTDIPPLRFAGLTVVATGAVSLTQPLTQVITTMQSPTLDIPVRVWINGAGEGSISVVLGTWDQSNTATTFSQEKPYMNASGGTLYLYATAEYLYAGIGSSQHVERAVFQHQYEQGQITKDEYDRALRSQTSDGPIAITAVPLTPTGR